jgi:formate dehydrogenase subunit gamma
MDQIIDLTRLDEILAEHASTPGGLLPILHAVQKTWGYVPPATVPAIAARLNLSRAEVHGVITYYHHFRDKPGGKTLIQMCRAEACQARGCDALIAHATKTVGCGLHETNGDGSVTLEPVYCLGHCATGPNIQVGEKLYGRMTPSRFDEIVMQSVRPGLEFA